MQVRNTSILTGVEHIRDIPVTSKELAEWQVSGTLVQDAFPHLSEDDREFLLSGITPEEWEASFGQEPSNES